ncbi:MAG TPA: hypothetical protein VHL11_01185, partial [Phototrophicaceae bacterium]|nr:hypothetical protein [Phototrophicaceae bacterium]
MLRLLSRLSTFLLIGLFTLHPILAQEEPKLLLSDEQPYPCPNTGGAFYQPGVFPRYDATSRNLILVNGQGEQVRVLEPVEQNYRVINWSPDCRYLTGVLGEIRGIGSYEGESIVDWTDDAERTIVIWDAIDGQSIFKLAPHFGHYLSIYPATVIWSPDSSRALILGGCYSVHYTCVVERTRVDYLWRRETNDVVRIGGFPISDVKTKYPAYTQLSNALFNQVYWDAARGWVWGSARYGVYTYDLNTGEQTAFYSNCEGCSAEARFLFSDDFSKVIIYSVASEGHTSEGGITVYDLATSTRIELNAEGFAAPFIPYGDYPVVHPVALSADNRYLVAGYDALRVW